MKTKFLAFVFFIISTSSTGVVLAQNRDNTTTNTLQEKGTKSTSATLDFTSKKKLYVIKRLPFNKVVVFDNRFDTTKYKIIKLHNSLTVGTFDKPASKAVENYIDKKINNYPKIPQTLYISIQQFRFTNNKPTKLFFYADAYVAAGTKYTKITSVKFESPFKISDRKIITNTLDRFIETINKDYAHPQNDTGYDMQNIKENVTDGWGNYPVESDSHIVNGIYASFSDFKNNRVIPTDLSLKMTSDSSYTLQLNDSSIFYNTRKKAIDIDNIWAVSYNGELYIAVMQKYFLPLHKINNRFYIYAPYTLPNMYYMAAAMKYSPVSSPVNSHVGYGSGTNFMPSNGKAAIIVLAVFVTVVIVAITILEIEKGEEHKYHPIETAAKSINENDLRNAFIDMDSGDIMYY